jgi:poly(A) polymerase
MEKALQLQAEIKKVFGDNAVNLVGGSVRDIVLGREPKDWDYCTPLEPDTVEQLIQKAGRKAYAVGKKFGTVGFKVQIDGKGEWYFVEVTTYRTEKYTGGSRKPEVEFITDLDADLARRDFTINAMVLKEDGSIYDPFGGRIDLLARLIKTVGAPKDRINEDPLRMLRAARFASQLEFNIDPNMIGKMRQLGPTIYSVSKERWVLELDKLLQGKDVMRGVKALVHSDLAKYILPEFYLSVQEEDVYELLHDVLTVNTDIPLDEKWALLHAYIAYPYTFELKKDRVTFVNHEAIRKELLEGICARLKFANSRRDALLKDKTIFKKSIDLQ